jgi:NAD(P)-dependent dehydrogenase (short-subunit alcohol dehydrogenase family)
MNLKGKVCLITGGTSGIGAATVLSLARQGAHIATVSRRGVAKDSDEMSALKEKGVAICDFKADLADPAACLKCVNQVIQSFGRLDVLVHAAGGPVNGGLHTVSDQQWMDAFAVHVHSVFHLARAATPYMALQGEGAIILLGSAAGLRGCLGALAYGVAKGALPQLVRALARELADQNIRVNCVSPGVVRTPFQNHLAPEQVFNNVLNRIPLHREGKPEDVAELIVALITNDFITGENFTIDGGMTMRIV